MARTNILFPVGRLVQGSLHKGDSTDNKGNPLVVKTGPNAGQPRVSYFFAVAISKGAETHWNQTAWGQQMWASGATGFPQHHALRAFAWKVVDGDDTEPNANLKRPCDAEGFPGHWVVKFSGGFAPKVYQQDGAAFPQLTAEAVATLKLGGYYKVSGNVDPNGDATKPGIYVNHDMVLFVGHGPEIVYGPDAASVFGAAGPVALPPGASVVPVGPAVMPVAAAVVVPPAAVAVVPHTAILTPPAAPVSPPVPPRPPAAPAAPARTLTAKAGGASYEALLGAGWTDATLVEHGLMA